MKSLLALMLIFFSSGVALPPGALYHVLQPEYSIKSNALKAFKEHYNINPDTLTKKDGEGNTYLHTVSAAKNDPKLIKLLLEAGLDVNEKNNSGRTPLHYYAVESHYYVPDLLSIFPERKLGRMQLLESIQLLINAGADINARDNNGLTPLHEAIGSFLNNSGVIPILINAGADVNAHDNSGITLLHKATNFPEILKLLLDAGANPNLQDHKGWTPLHDAIYIRNSKSAQMLINAGADVNARDKNGKTPLYMALAHRFDTAVLDHPRRYELAKILLAAGAQVNIKDNEGYTPLQRATKDFALVRGKEPILEALINAGAKVNVQNNQGDTALHIIIALDDYPSVTWAPSVSITQLLLSAGANPTLRNKKGETPLDLNKHQLFGGTRNEYLKQLLEDATKEWQSKHEFKQIAHDEL